MKIHKVEKLTAEKWLNLYSAQFENRGHTGRWVFASRQSQPVAKRRADAVIIVPLLLSPPALPKLVIIKEFRVPVQDWVYAFPAGLVEDGEEIETAARREMFEETGLKITRFKQISPVLFASAGMCDESARMVFVDVEAEGEPRLEQSEELEVQLLDYAAACRLCDDSGAMLDARLWMTLFMYKTLGRFE